MGSRGSRTEACGPMRFRSACSSGGVRLRFEAEEPLVSVLPVGKGAQVPQGQSFLFRTPEASRELTTGRRRF